MTNLNEFLKELRGNESLRSVSERTGLSHSYIADLEKGFRRGTKKPIHPSADTLNRLAKAYNYPPNELLKKAGYIEEDPNSKVESYDPLSVIRDYLIKRGKTDQFGFFNIKEWEELTPEQVENIIEDMEHSFQREKKRAEKKGL